MLGLENLFGSDAASEAADIEARAARKGADEYEKYADEAQTELEGGLGRQRSDLGNYYRESLGFTKPYREAGEASLRDYQASLGMGTPDERSAVVEQFRGSPGYKFALEQGVKAREAQAAARGTLHSGGMLKELTRFGQGLADQQYQGFQDRLRRMAEYGGDMGRSSAEGALQTGQQLGGAEERTATRVGDVRTGIGTARAESELAAGAARASGVREQAKARQASGGFVSGLLGGAGSMVGGPVGGLIGRAAGAALGGF